VQHGGAYPARKGRKVALITVNEYTNPRRFASRHLAVAPLPFHRILCTFTGVIVIDFRGVSPSYWTKDTLRVGLEQYRAIGEAQAQGWLESHTPLPSAGHVYYVTIRDDDIASLVTVNSGYNQNWADNDGKAVDAVSVVTNAADKLRGVANTPLLTFDASLAVRDSDAYLHRVGYQVTAVATVGTREPDIATVHTTESPT
jgi:hypothetical protein